MSQVSNPVYPLIWQIHYGWLLYEQGRESIMFEYCPMVNKNCPYAATYKGEKHCGLKTGSLNENKIKNMKKCPKKDKKWKTT